LPTIGRGQQVQHWQFSELVVFLTAVAFLVMEQRMISKLCFKSDKTLTETYEMLWLSMVMKPEVVAVYLNGLNDLKTSVRIIRMIQEAGVLQPLEMQTQSQMFVKW
jgi:hypothetical protein